MSTIINIFLIGLLILISFQDFKKREISWVLIPLAFIAFIAKGVRSIDNEVMVKNTVLNFAFIAIQILFLTLYMSIKNKRPVNILNEYIGLGDVLFFVVLCTAFSPINFILFYLLSTIITLILAIGYRTLSKKELSEIPLAGAMASILMVLMVIPQLDFYDDTNWLCILTR